MKRILFLLLLTVSVYGQNPSRFAKIQITGNTNSGTATKVNVQEANGEVNTQTINTGFNKNIGLGGSDVVGANTLLNQYSTTPVDWTATAFNSGQVVFYGGKQWLAKIATVAGDVPSVSLKWEEITFEALANKTVTVDQTIIDGSTNAVSGNAVFDGLALKNELIAHLKFNNADKTIWNNGYSNVTTATSYGERAGRLASGSYWTANGFQAGYSNTTGSNWTANGSQAGYSNTTGSNWTANGSQAGYSNTTGNYWTANGFQAGFFNTTGSNWTANGYRAGGYLANGTSPLLKLNDGVFIGADTKALEDNSINEIVIGYNATGLGSNSSVIGNSSTLRSRIWGRFLSGTSVDDGVNQLQVAGTISASPATTANQVPTWGQVFDGLATKSNIGHTHVASQITDLSKASVGLGNVDNTSDLSKPLSTATQTALNGKENSFTKNTAFNKPFGITAGTVVEGGTLGTNAYSSTSYLPLTGGTLSGYLSLNDGIGLVLGDESTSRLRFITSSGVNYIQSGTGSGYGTRADLVITGNYGGNETVRFKDNGRILINKTDDDLTNKLQVAGTISASPATTANQVPTWGQVQAIVKPYKVYTALLTQTGTNAPVAIVLENTLGGTIVWSRNGLGSYSGTLSGVFTTNKTYVSAEIGELLTGYGDNVTIYKQSTINEVTLTTIKTNNNSDGVLKNSPLEIRVYN